MESLYRLKRVSARFARAQDGALSVESVLWIPVYLLFFVVIADVSTMFSGQAKAVRIAYDGNRQASLGDLASPQQVEAAVLSRVRAFSPGATASTVFGPDSITTTLTMPAAELAAVGTFARLVDFDVTVSSVHMRED